MIYVFLADGFEEAEALVTVDILRRAEIDVATVGVGKSLIEGTHGITVTADITTGEFSPDDMTGVILPGGMPGTTNLEADKIVLSAVKHAYSNNLPVAAICAAPSILGHLGLLKGEKATCYPGFENDLIGAKYVNASAVTSGNIITAKGAGAVFEFGFSIIDYIKGNKEVSKNLRETMQCAL
ncbi:MAG: DJ-1/PfpI family protein [Clostridia bacterium]|nr:DJ-1/PfpI family protein [Clostridia bacterium]